jgi:hypothetical protein
MPAAKQHLLVRLQHQHHQQHQQVVVLIWTRWETPWML